MEDHRNDRLPQKSLKQDQPQAQRGLKAPSVNTRPQGCQLPVHWPCSSPAAWPPNESLPNSLTWYLPRHMSPGPKICSEGQDPSLANKAESVAQLGHATHGSQGSSQDRLWATSDPVCREWSVLWYRAWQGSPPWRLHKHRMTATVPWNSCAKGYRVGCSLTCRCA